MKSWDDVRRGDVLAGVGIVGSSVNDRTAGGQMEWERWKRVVGTMCAGLRQAAGEIEHLVWQLDIDVAQETELLRLVEVLRSWIEELDGENWLKSPLAMAEMRSQGPMGPT